MAGQREKLPPGEGMPVGVSMEPLGEGAEDVPSARPDPGTCLGQRGGRAWTGRGAWLGGFSGPGPAGRQGLNRAWVRCARASRALACAGEGGS